MKLPNSILRTIFAIRLLAIRSLKSIYVHVNFLSFRIFGIQDKRVAALVAAKFYEDNKKEKAATVFDNCDLNQNQQRLACLRLLEENSDDEWIKNVNTILGIQNQTKLMLAPEGKNRFWRLEAQEQSVLSMQHQPLVTVIMPVYNSQATIKNAAKSILNQSWKNLELIIVDDASTDCSYELAKELALADSRVSVIRSNKNFGPYAAKNIALNYVRGVYFTCHDADDYALPQRIEIQAKAMQNNPEMIINVANMLRIDNNGKLHDVRWAMRSSKDGFCHVAPITAMFDTNSFKTALGHWDSVAFGADSELLERAKLLFGSKVVFLPEVLLFSLFHSQSLTVNEKTGIQSKQGLRLRTKYQIEWAIWHQSIENIDSAYLPFPHMPRKFEVPEELIKLRPFERTDIEYRGETFPLFPSNLDPSSNYSQNKGTKSER